MKICNKCGIEKDESEFYKYDAKETHGLRSDCKSCAIIVVRQSQNTEKIRKYKRTSNCMDCNTPIYIKIDYVVRIVMVNFDLKILKEE